ncbi:unnamed protein product [Auanema sp. JU1783]|nr:unnamed protein product [Auanema sp. JU1783]
MLYDPNDPTAIMRNAEEKAPSSSLDDPSLKLILRRFFQQLSVDPFQRSFFSISARLSLTSYNMAAIADYLDSEKDNVELRDRVRTALHDIVELVETEDTYQSMWNNILLIVQPWLVFANVVILLPALILVLRTLRPRSYWMYIIIFITVHSMFTTYNRLYEEKLAERIAARESMENACAPTSLFEQAFDVVSGMVSFKKKSKCVAFIETQTVSIVNEISLFSVLTDVISHGVFGFLSNCGIHINKFVKDVFTDMPMQGVLIIGIASVFLFVGTLLLFVQVKIPFFFSTEPILLPLLQAYMVSTPVRSDEIPAISSSGEKELCIQASSASEKKIQQPTEKTHSQPKALTNVTDRSPQRKQNIRKRVKQRYAEENSSSADDELERDSSQDTKRSLRALSPS